MRILDDVKYDFSDVLIVPKRSTLTTRKEVNIQRSFKFKWADKQYWIDAIPIIAANMDGVGTFTMENTLREYSCFTALTKHYSVEDYVEAWKEDTANPSKHNAFFSIGMRDEDLKKLQAVIARLQERTQTDRTDFYPYICVDVANGYTERFAAYVEQVRRLFPQLVIMAGNVVTPEMTEELILAGADIVKIGIGPGSVCTTRKIAGVGYPQLSAIIECMDAAHGLKGHICGDGGCTTPGDVAKAFAAGADFVMLGGMLAGHDEGGGQIVEQDGKHYVEFYGMSSQKAQTNHNGGVAYYRASEGKRVLVPYRGGVRDTIKEILGGVRSACTYTGSITLKELPKRTTFVKVNRTHNTVFGDDHHTK